MSETERQRESVEGKMGWGYFVCVDWLISHRRFFFLVEKEGYGWIDDDDDMFIHQRDSPNKHT